jgi:Ser/Thr protein kinase RdoA (MazF antagonist)
MPLFHVMKASRDDVAAIVSDRWGLELGAELKASQNVTYEASDASTGRKFVVRVTPDDEEGRNASRVADELFFVAYAARHMGDGEVAAPVAPRAGSDVPFDAESDTGGARLLVRARNVLVSVFDFARGAMLPYLEYRWMTDKSVVHATGAWLGNFHAVSRRFGAAYPTIATRMQRWDEMHSGVLKDAPVAPADAAVEGDSAHWGVLHGDVNPSNYFVFETEGAPPRMSMFDWDQAQRGWYLWDLAQPIFGVLMLAEAGSVVDTSPVPEADLAAYQDEIVAGYESVAGVGSVDRARLARMLALRKYFYGVFCRRALAEGGVPPAIATFLEYIVKWQDRMPVDLSLFAAS